MDDTLDVFSFMQTLHAVKRYSRDEMKHQESVLEHTGCVVTYSLILAKKIERLLPVKVNYSDLLTKAVVHDWDEVGTGDIPRTTKYASDVALSAIKVLEEESVRTIERYLNLKDMIVPVWMDSKDNTLEGQIVKIADMSSVVYCIWHQIVRRSNFSFLRVSLEAQGQIDKLKVS